MRHAGHARDSPAAAARLVLPSLPPLTDCLHRIAAQGKRLQHVIILQSHDEPARARTRCCSSRRERSSSQRERSSRPCERAGESQHQQQARASARAGAAAAAGASEEQQREQQRQQARQQQPRQQQPRAAARG